MSLSEIDVSKMGDKTVTYIRRDAGDFLNLALESYRWSYDNGQPPHQRQSLIRLRPASLNTVRSVSFGISLYKL